MGIFFWKKWIFKNQKGLISDHKCAWKNTDIAVSVVDSIKGPENILLYIFVADSVSNDNIQGVSLEMSFLKTLKKDLKYKIGPHFCYF